MVDLTSEMADLWSALGPGHPGRGRVIQFVSASRGEGTSTVAREFARLAATRSRRPAWLIDADLDDQSQMAAVDLEADRFGRLGRIAGASPDRTCFFTVRPPCKDRTGKLVSDSALLRARSAMAGRLWVTRLRLEMLRYDQRVEILPIGAYWEAMRRHADYVVVDSPSADRSDTAFTLAPLVDTTVIVLAAEQTEPGTAAALRAMLEETGGRVAGLVFNRCEVEPPAILQRLVS